MTLMMTGNSKPWKKEKKKFNLSNLHFGSELNAFSSCQLALGVAESCEGGAVTERGIDFMSENVAEICMHTKFCTTKSG